MMMMTCHRTLVGKIRRRTLLSLTNNNNRVSLRLLSTRLTTGNRTKLRDWKGYQSRPPPPPLGGIPTYVWATAAGTAGLVGYTYYAFLDTVPLTHRKRWLATSPQWEQQLGDDEYQKLLQSVCVFSRAYDRSLTCSMEPYKISSLIASSS